MNQKGISILEVLIGAAVMMVVAAGLSTLILTQANQVSYLEDRMSYQDLKKEIDKILDNPDACRRSLEGTRVPVAPTARTGTNLMIRNENGTVFLNPTTAPNNRYDKLVIEGISFANESLGSGETWGKGKLLVATSRTRTGVGPDHFSVIEKEIYMETTAARDIISCSGVSSGGGPCLKTDRPLTGSTVPGDAKALGISVPGDSASFNDSGNGGSQSIQGFSMILPLDGSLHPRFVPGGRFEMNSGDVIYNGIMIAQRPRCNCTPPTCSCTGGRIIYQKTGMAICTTPSHPAPGSGVVIYK